MDPSLQEITPQRVASHTRSFSARSDKSGEDRAPSSTEKADKARRDSVLRGENKANPNAAINEVQPAVAALIERSTLHSIRDVQHKDAHGNVIAEPDLSNPTRPRWERPLDTIRSFEKAIDGGYKRRSISRAASETYDSSNQYASRRSSYFGGPESGGPSPSRHSQVGGGYYGGRRPESYVDHNGQPGPPRQRYGPRGTSDSAVNRLNGNGYSQHGHHQSHDTVNTGVTNGSDSTGPWNNSTDPSSESSSPDRYHAGERKQHNVETYGYDSFGGGPILEEHATDDRSAYPQRMQQAPNGYPVNGGGPHVPAHKPERTPIKLGGGGGSDAAFSAQTGTLPTVARPAEEKRKSWLKRRFSKKE